MCTHVLRSTILTVSILAVSLFGTGFTWAQDAGAGGQVPGPNATQPQANAQSATARTSVQPAPGAMPGSDAVPSTLSEKNAADDKLATVAYTFKNLTDEDRRAIYQALRGQSAAGSAPNATLGVALPPSVELRPVPQDVVARVPQLNSYQYTVAGDKVLLVSPVRRGVVGEFTGQLGAR